MVDAKTGGLRRGHGDLEALPRVPDSVNGGCVQWVVWTACPRHAGWLRQLVAIRPRVLRKRIVNFMAGRARSWVYHCLAITRWLGRISTTMRKWSRYAGRGFYRVILTLLHPPTQRQNAMPVSNVRIYNNSREEAERTGADLFMRRLQRTGIFGITRSPPHPRQKAHGPGWCRYRGTTVTPGPVQ